MTRLQLMLLVCLALAAGLTSGVPRGKNKAHLGPTDLSDETHYHPAEDGEEGEDGEHNVAYDHEAFLGKEEAKRFDEMEPEEARRKLGLIVDKIDKDEDGFVSEQELEDWVRHVARRHVVNDAERFWSYYDKNGDGAVDWDEYMQRFQGVEDLDAIYDTYHGLTFRRTQQRDQRRFQLADRDSNGHLNKEEFVDFLHPEEAGPYMRDLVIDETMASMDRDQDGYINIDEYLRDLGVRYGNDPYAEESEWVPREKNNFNSWDKDQNKKLDREELGDWIMPKGYNPALAEAKHLIHAADTDEDKKLTKAEIQARQDHFVGSRVTDYGTYHEEL